MAFSDIPASVQSMIVNRLSCVLRAESLLIQAHNCGKLGGGGAGRYLWEFRQSGVVRGASAGFREFARDFGRFARSKGENPTELFREALKVARAADAGRVVRF